jgi:hypothetical protein
LIRQSEPGTGFIFLLVVVCRCDEVLTFLFKFDDESTFTRLAEAHIRDNHGWTLFIQLFDAVIAILDPNHDLSTATAADS